MRVVSITLEKYRKHLVSTQLGFIGVCLRYHYLDRTIYTHTFLLWLQVGLVMWIVEREFISMTSCFSPLIWTSGESETNNCMKIICRHWRLLFHVIMFFFRDCFVKIEQTQYSLLHGSASPSHSSMFPTSSWV